MTLIGLAGCVLAFVLIGVGGHDDSYITDWAAKRFADTGRIVNYNGSSIEQATSLLQVVLLGAARWITRLPVPILGYLLGLVGFVATVVAVGRWTREINPQASLIAGTLTVVAYPLLYWATSGLETLLVSAFLLSFLLTFLQFLNETHQVARAGLLLAIATLLFTAVRPDAILLVAGLVAFVALGAFCAHRGPTAIARWFPEVSLRQSLVAAVPTGAATAMVETLRFALFRKLVPQPVVAKTGSTLSVSSIRAGLRYVGKSLHPGWLWFPLIVLAGWGVVMVIRSRSLAGWMTIAAGGLGVAIVIASGGDWMGAARFLVPDLALLFVLVAVGITELPTLQRSRARGSSRRRPQVVIATLLVVVLELSALSAFVGDAAFTGWTFNLGSPLTDSWSAFLPNGTPVHIPGSVSWYDRRNASHLSAAIFVTTTRPKLAGILEQMPKPRDKLTLASGQAGLLPYQLLGHFPGRIRFIDQASLSTADFSHCSGLAHASTGLAVTFKFWIAHAGTCAPPLPDVIVGLGRFTNQSVLARHYQLVYQQNLVIERKGASQSFVGEMYLAVRDGFLPSRPTLAR